MSLRPTAHISFSAGIFGQCWNSAGDTKCQRGISATAQFRIDCQRRSAVTRKRVDVRSGSAMTAIRRGRNASVTPIGTEIVGLPDRDRMNATLAQHWWTIVLRGVIAVLFRIFALAAPGAVLLSLAFCSVLPRDSAGGSRSRPLGCAAGGGCTEHSDGAASADHSRRRGFGLRAPDGGRALMSGGLMLWAALRLHVSHGR